jgi:lipopolysaccharide/colanic/teichoic acid biosynthesis glycosyltransferase
MLKRAFDLTVASCGLVLLFPLLVLLAALVRLGSPGPALFRQIRVGRGGHDFTLFKFRTMTVRQGTDTRSFDAGDGSRVTPLGRLLRRTKLDELPQLWNVVRGDMALVGPRPEVRAWVAVYPERWAFVHAVRPGITDPASLLYRDEESLLAASPDPARTYREEILPHKLDLYETYLRNRSFLGDVIILVRTVFAVLRRAPGGSGRGRPGT